MWKRLFRKRNVDMKGMKTRKEFGHKKDIEKREGGQER
jgi:hypothetical protein